MGLLYLENHINNTIASEYNRFLDALSETYYLRVRVCQYSSNCIIAHNMNMNIICVSGSVNLSAVKIISDFRHTYFIIQIYMLVSGRSYNRNKIELCETSLCLLAVIKRTAY